MRKQLVIIGIFLTLVLTSMAILPTTSAHTEDEPLVITLLAGQDIPVGEVNVWNDEENLYVEYEITECGWEILDTHLYVGKTDPNTLTTAPGQFPYSGETEYVIQLDDICGYEMELNKKDMPTGKMAPIDGTCGVDSEDHVYIAAHADVRYLESTEWVELITNGGFETPAISSDWAIVPDDDLPGWTTAPNVPDTFGDPEGLEIQKNLLVTAYEGDQYAELDAYYPIILTQTVPACESGEYKISYAYMPRPNVRDNQMTVEFGDADYTATWTADGTVLTDWVHVSCSGITGPTEGTVDLVFTETGPDDQLGMFLDDVSVACKVYNYIYESAWAEGTDFDHPNWAMYFEYNPCKEYHLDITSVNDNSGYTHWYDITYCPETDELTGEGGGCAGSETISDISLVGDVISFTAVYDSNGYTWYPSFTLEAGGTLTFIDGHGSDNVNDATGTWTKTWA